MKRADHRPGRPQYSRPEAATGVDLMLTTPGNRGISALWPSPPDRQNGSGTPGVRRPHSPPALKMWLKVEQEMDVQRCAKWANRPPSTPAMLTSAPTSYAHRSAQIPRKLYTHKAMLQHSLEVSSCAASWLQNWAWILRPPNGRACCDIGKAVDHEVRKAPTPFIGADIAKNTANTRTSSTPLPPLRIRRPNRPGRAGQAADAVRRPARRARNCWKSLRKAPGRKRASFNGVASCCHPGRSRKSGSWSIRTTWTTTTPLLCKDIAGQIEQNLTYPGQIRGHCYPAGTRRGTGEGKLFEIV